MRSVLLVAIATAVGLLQVVAAEYDPDFEDFNWQLVTDIFDETVFQLEKLDVPERDLALKKILKTAFEVKDYIQDYMKKEGAKLAQKLLKEKRPNIFGSADEEKKGAA